MERGIHVPFGNPCSRTNKWTRRRTKYKFQTAPASHVPSLFHYYTILSRKAPLDKSLQKMTKNYKKGKTATQTPKTASKESNYSSDYFAGELEEFPSPPKKDGTKDNENILAKKRREAEEAKAKAKAGSSSGGKKG